MCTKTIWREPQFWLQKIKENISKWRNIPCPWIRRLYVVKISILPNLMYRFKTIQIKISINYFLEIWKIKRPRINEHNTEGGKQKTLGGLMLIGEDLDAGKDWRQEEKGMIEGEMAEWHHRLNGHEFAQALRVDDGQGSLACCPPWGQKELDMTERLNWI